MPEFPGGPDSLHAYLSRTIQYPQDARDKGVSGTVLAEFVVEKDGRVGQVTIKVPLFPSCDEEVVRVLQQMPLWKPATNQGQPIRCFFAVPVTFRNDTSLEKGDWTAEKKVLDNNQNMTNDNQPNPLLLAMFWLVIVSDK